jgi:hypothetical protein
MVNWTLGFKMYGTVVKTSITSVDILNDRDLPFNINSGNKLILILTDHGTEYCDKMENHGYEFYFYSRILSMQKLKLDIIRKTEYARDSIVTFRMNVIV